MAGDIGFHGDSIAWFEGRYGWMNRDDLSKRESGWRWVAGKKETNLACRFMTEYVLVCYYHWTYAPCVPEMDVRPTQCTITLWSKR